ncbi:MAG: hypothetical protein WC670_03410 [Pseudolabrys sp.]|jgi:hypothetical protein
MFSVQNPAVFDPVPELGMGFHFGIVRSSRDKNPEGVIVLNSELAITSSDILNFEAFRRWQSTQGQEVRPGVVITVIMSPEPAPKADIVPSEDIVLFKSTFGSFLFGVERFDVRHRLHASPPFQLRTQSGEKFARFSAFKNDRRVLADGSLLPGSYVTSELDAGLAPSGFAVVGRYALPNPLSAINRFDIVVPVQTPGLVGTVLPAFGQAGGGVEVELTHGAPPGSVAGPVTIPEY